MIHWGVEIKTITNNNNTSTYEVKQMNNNIYFTGKVCARAIDEIIYSINSIHDSLKSEILKIIEFLRDKNDDFYISQNDKLNHKLYHRNEFINEQIKRQLEDNIEFYENLYNKIYTILKDKNCIHFYISSTGGSLLDGFKLVDYIEECFIQGVNIYSYCLGYCASAATLFFLCCTKRFMYSNSYILIHQLSSSTCGKFQEMKDDIENYEIFMKRIKGVYIKYTNIDKDKLDTLLLRDKWWDLETCLELGIKVEKIN